MTSRLLIGALIWILTVSAARANDAYLILSDITWNIAGSTLTFHPAVMTLVDRKASITIANQKSGVPPELAGRACKLEFICRDRWVSHPGSLQFDMNLSLGPRHVSHTSGTLVEGQTCEASIDDNNHSSVEYRVTAWKVPEGKRFHGRDAEGKPIFAPEAGRP